MMMRGVACLLLLVALAYAVIEPGRAQTISCSNVDSAIAPCAQYITGQATAPSASCCNGVRSIHSAARTTQARRATCSCLRATAARYSNINDQAAQGLAGRCGVSVGIPISRNTDCSKIT